MDGAMGPTPMDVDAEPIADIVRGMQLFFGTADDKVPQLLFELVEWHRDRLRSFFATLPVDAAADSPATVQTFADALATYARKTFGGAWAARARATALADARDAALRRFRETGRFLDANDATPRRYKSMLVLFHPDKGGSQDAFCLLQREFSLLSS